MKKLFSLLTALALSLALALSVAAAGTPTIVAKADNDALKRGDTFYVTVSLDNNPGICLMQVAVVFDEKVFEFVDVENGTLITSSLCARPRERCKAGLGARQGYIWRWQAGPPGVQSA